MSSDLKAGREPSGKVQESTWLMDSLRESSERAAKLPQWAKAINAAHAAQYGDHE